MNDVWIGAISAIGGAIAGASIPTIVQHYQHKSDKKERLIEKNELFARIFIVDFLPLLDDIIGYLKNFKTETNDDFLYNEIYSQDAKEALEKARIIFQEEIIRIFPLEAKKHIENMQSLMSQVFRLTNTFSNQKLFNQIQRNRDLVTFLNDYIKKSEKDIKSVREYINKKYI